MSETENKRLIGAAGENSTSKGGVSITSVEATENPTHAQ